MSATKVYISSGQFHLTDGSAIDVENTTFTLKAPIYKDFMVVDPSTAEPRNSVFYALGNTAKVFVKYYTDYEVLSNKPRESDEDIIERLRKRFRILSNMTLAVKTGAIKALIVSGPAGVGKSYGVEDVLSREDLFNMVGDLKPKYRIMKGVTSALGLYTALFEMSAPESVLVFDDCNIEDEISLNILKAALDTSRKRTIYWNTNSRILKEEDVPRSFDFNGGVIFITNSNFSNFKGKKLGDHIDALISRCHFIDLDMDGYREKFLRIKQIINDGLLTSYNFNQDDRDELIYFVKKNLHKLREISLRTVLKAADLKKSFPDEWEEIANVTLLTH